MHAVQDIVTLGDIRKAGGSWKGGMLVHDHPVFPRRAWLQAGPSPDGCVRVVPAEARVRNTKATQVRG